MYGGETRTITIPVGIPRLATNEIAAATETAKEIVAKTEMATGVEMSAETGAGTEFLAAPRTVASLARPSEAATAGQWKRERKVRPTVLQNKSHLWEDQVRILLVAALHLAT